MAYMHATWTPLSCCKTRYSDNSVYISGSKSFHFQVYLCGPIIDFSHMQFISTLCFTTVAIYFFSFRIIHWWTGRRRLPCFLSTLGRDISECKGKWCDDNCHCQLLCTCAICHLETALFDLVYLSACRMHCLTLNSFTIYIAIFIIKCIILYIVFCYSYFM